MASSSLPADDPFSPLAKQHRRFRSLLHAWPGNTSQERRSVLAELQTVGAHAKAEATHVHPLYARIGGEAGSRYEEEARRADAEMEAHLSKLASFNTNGELGDDAVQSANTIILSIRAVHAEHMAVSAGVWECGSAAEVGI